MVRKRVVALVMALAAAMAISACGANGNGDGSGTTASLEARAWTQVDEGALLLDVRTPKEYSAGHLEGAKNIPHDQIKARIGELGTDKDRVIVLYCRSGRRTGIAAGALQAEGFTNIFDAKRYDRMKAEWERRKG